MSESNSMDVNLLRRDVTRLANASKYRNKIINEQHDMIVKCFDNIKEMNKIIKKRDQQIHVLINHIDELTKMVIEHNGNVIITRTRLAAPRTNRAGRRRLQLHV
nr:Caab100 [Calliteara abietis nucleopolyhedrovirus]